MKKKSNWQGGERYGAAWKRLRKVVIRRDNHLCQQCYREGKLTTGSDCDHIVPVAKGGTDELSNLEMLCRYHHQKKTTEEVGATFKSKGADVSGLPTDPAHPWRK